MRFGSVVRAQRRQFLPRLEALEDRACPAAPMISLSNMASGPQSYMLRGNVCDDAAGGLTVTFTGAYSGSVVTNSMGGFEIQVQPSQLGAINASVIDGEGLAASASTTVANSVPMIMGFMASRSINNIWTFSGMVSDEHAIGLTVTLGGLPSLIGKTAVVNSNGSFSITVEIPNGETGTATAVTTDWWGQQSNETQYLFFPTA